MAYFITLKEAEDFQISPQDLTHQLASKWPPIEFEMVVLPNDPFTLSWKIEIEGKVQLGALHRDNQTVSIDDWPDGAAKFAIWYRSIISARYRLFICHDSSDEEIELKPESTEEEILDNLNEM